MLELWTRLLTIQSALTFFTVFDMSDILVTESCHTLMKAKRHVRRVCLCTAMALEIVPLSCPMDSLYLSSIKSISTWVSYRILYVQSYLITFTLDLLTG